jgi:YesN/AraC family two-component response regulator
MDTRHQKVLLLSSDAHQKQDLHNRKLVVGTHNRKLVISDLMMPEMNGYQFIKKVKEIKPQVKVFFISAFEIDDIEFKRELPFVKVDEFIQKPISLEDLISTVNKHINN